MRGIEAIRGSLIETAMQMPMYVSCAMIHAGVEGDAMQCPSASL
ncbi:MAG: hypothetical protein U9R51_07560 [Actinomycetota bacterium]|nr:hypothetical protein [Actinomycetota bacterium]